jgi:hypothetical protein
MRKTKTRERGQAVIEVTLLAPWIFFLFVGITDFGFYAYQAICVENAARVAAMQIAKSPGYGSSACQLAIPEMSKLPNVMYLLANSGTPCAEGTTTVTQAIPIGVCVGTLSKTASTPCGFARTTPPPDPCPGECADCCLDNTATSTVVAVTYQSLPMVNIPGILTNQLTLRRFAEMRILQ